MNNKYHNLSIFLTQNNVKMRRKKWWFFEGSSLLSATTQQELKVFTAPSCPLCVLRGLDLGSNRVTVIDLPLLVAPQPRRAAPPGVQRPS